MAIQTSYDALNPQVGAVQPPRFFSEPLKDFQFANTTGAALKATGDILEGAIKGSDEVVKAFVRDDVRKEVEPQKYAYEEALSGGLKYTQNALSPTPTRDQVPAGQSENTEDPLSLAPPYPDNLPNDIRQLPNTLASLQGARASGKLSETDYYARLSTTAKDIRSRYPAGYREYIDAQIQQVTGVDPANAYIKSVIGDINSLIGNQQKEKEHALAYYREHAGALTPEDFSRSYNAIVNGTLSPADGMTHIQPAMRRMFERDDAEKEIKFRREQGTENKEFTEKKVNEQFSAVAQKYAYGITTAPGSTSMQTIEDTLNKALAGRLPLDGPTMLKMADGVRSMANQAEAEMRAEAAKTTNGQSHNSVLGTDKVNAMVKANRELFDNVADHLTHKDTGAAFATLRANEALKTKAEAIYLDPDGSPISNYLLTSNVFHKNGGDPASTALVQHEMANGLQGKVATAVEYATKRLATPASPQNSTTSLSKSIDQLNNYNKNIGSSEVVAAKSFKALTDNVEDIILNEKIGAGVRVETFKKTFNQENWGVLRKIKPDEYDPKTGKTTPGYQSLYYRFTNPEMVEAAKKLDAQEPGLFKMYTDWVNTSFEQDISKDSVSKMKDLPALTASSGYQMTWNDVGHRFAIIDGRGKEITTQSNQLVQIVSGLNKGIRGIANVAKSNPQYDAKDVDAHVLQSLVDAGVPPENLTGIKGIPYSMVQLLRGQQQMREAYEAKEKVRKKAIQDKYTPKESE